MSEAEFSSSGWETEGLPPSRLRRRGGRSGGRKKGRGKKGRGEGCAALRLGGEEGVAGQARRLREALSRVREARQSAGSPRPAGREWQVAMLRAIRDGESSAPSSGPGDDDWGTTQGTSNPTPRRVRGRDRDMLRTPRRVRGHNCDILRTPRRVRGHNCGVVPMAGVLVAGMERDA